MEMNYIIKEKYIRDSISEFGINGIEEILFQMKHCACKIYKSEKITGSGFFCSIPLGNKNDSLPVLITNNHVLNKDDIVDGKTIKITLYNNKEIIKLKIDNSRKKITNEEFDFTIIEIKPNKDNIKSFLDIDENINKEQELFKLKYQNTSLYILHYPENNDIKISFGLLKDIEDNIIFHKCSTHNGSSGSPILSLDTFKVIGIHFGATNLETNQGVFIQKTINEFNDKFKN